VGVVVGGEEERIGGSKQQINGVRDEMKVRYRQQAAQPPKGGGAGGGGGGDGGRGEGAAIPRKGQGAGRCFMVTHTGTHTGNIAREC
jgi:hypothetical protein